MCACAKNRVCKRKRERERKKANPKNHSRMQQNGVYRNIASILNSTKLGEPSRLLNKYKNERENACERKRERK